MADHWRCVKKANDRTSLNACGDQWLKTIMDHGERKNRAEDAARKAKSKDERRKSSDGVHAVGGDLGLGPEALRHLSKIASRYQVSPRSVGNMAAKSSELCLGGMQAISENPALAVRKATGALEFVAGVKLPKSRKIKSKQVEELFVTYVTMGCPDPSR